jgi:hypothetical protein
MAQQAGTSQLPDGQSRGITMKGTLIIGIALIVMGAALLGYQQYSYTTTEQVLKIGPLTANAEKTHTVSFPPILGWLLIAGGAGALVLGALSNKR